jgi:2-hydroxychromene-2-carboxylate isomerase
VTKEVDIYYALASPWAYLGFQRFRDMVARHGAVARYKPVRLAEVFKSTGGLPLAQRPPARRAYRMMELKRWRDRLGLPLNLEPRFFPVDDGLAARMVVAHRLQGGDPAPLSQAILEAVWVQEQNIADPATLESIADAQGLPGTRLLAEAESEAVRRTLDSDTQEALARGVFGAPSFVIGEEVFWGQDRLDFVEESLAG